jgi:hypothetical protein
VTCESFDELYRHWTLALYRSGRSSASFKNDSTLDAANERFADADDYRSLDLRGRLSNFALAGPLAQMWPVDERTHDVAVRGTSSAFVELTANGGGIRRVKVQGDYGSRLHVSLVRIADDWPQIVANVSWSENGDTILLTHSSPSPTRELTVRVTGDVADDHEVETIACERNHDETRESFCFSGEALQRYKHSVSAPGDRGRDTIVFKLPVPPPSATTEPSSGRLHIKVISVDAKGRRSTAWATLDDEPVDATLQFAEAVE